MLLATILIMYSDMKTNKLCALDNVLLVLAGNILCELCYTLLQTLRYTLDLIA